jgi:hypothetical protein
VHDSLKPRSDVPRNREGTDKAKRNVLVHDVLFTLTTMQAERAYEFSPSVRNANKVIAVGTGAALLAYGAVRQELPIHEVYPRGSSTAQTDPRGGRHRASGGSRHDTPMNTLEFNIPRPRRL